MHQIVHVTCVWCHKYKVVTWGIHKDTSYLQNLIHKCQSSTLCKQLFHVGTSPYLHKVIRQKAKEKKMVCDFDSIMKLMVSLDWAEPSLFPLLESLFLKEFCLRTEETKMVVPDLSPWYGWVWYNERPLYYWW